MWCVATWCIMWCMMASHMLHRVRYLARLRELEVGGSVDVVQREVQLRWGKRRAARGLAKGASLSLSSSLPLVRSPLTRLPPPLLPLFSPCQPPSTPLPHPSFPRLARSRLGNRDDLTRRAVDEAEAKVGPPVIEQVDLAKGGRLACQTIVARLLGRVLRGVRDHKVETATLGLADARWRSRMGEGWVARIYCHRRCARGGW